MSLQHIDIFKDMKLDKVINRLEQIKKNRGPKSKPNIIQYLKDGKVKMSQRVGAFHFSWRKIRRKRCL